VVSFSKFFGRLMIMMASKGHFCGRVVSRRDSGGEVVHRTSTFTQIPQPMQSSSEIHEILEVGATSMHSLPVPGQHRVTDDGHTLLCAAPTYRLSQQDSSFCIPVDIFWAYIYMLKFQLVSIWSHACSLDALCLPGLTDDSDTGEGLLPLIVLLLRRHRELWSKTNLCGTRYATIYIARRHVPTDGTSTRAGQAVAATDDS
jgi:hypothetical protein